MRKIVIGLIIWNVILTIVLIFMNVEFTHPTVDAKTLQIIEDCEVLND